MNEKYVSTSDETLASNIENLLGVPYTIGGVASESPAAAGINQRVDTGRFIYDALNDYLGGIADSLTDDVLASFRQTHEETLARMALRLMVADRFTHHADLSKALGVSARADMQHGALGKAFDHFRTAPAYRSEQTRPFDELLANDGFLIASPTGSGKSAIEAVVAAALKPRSKEEIEQPKFRVVVALPSAVLMRQYSDPQDAFLRFYGQDAGIRVTNYWGEQKDPTGHLVRMTTHSLPEALKRGHITQRNFFILDEAHHGLEPKMLPVLHQAAALLALTATPAYEIRRGREHDLRNVLSHIETGSMLNFVKSGLLNQVRIMDFRSNGNNEVEMAVSFALHCLKQGRKIIMYCEPGGLSSQAKDIADLINEQVERKVAGAVGKFPRNTSVQDVAGFKAGKLSILTTTKMAAEGFDDPDVDTIVRIGNVRSLLQLTQEAGRGLRAKSGKPETLLAHIAPMPRKGSRLVTFWQVLGLRNVTDEVIGPGYVDKPKTGHADKSKTDYADDPKQTGYFELVDGKYIEVDPAVSREFAGQFLVGSSLKQQPQPSLMPELPPTLRQALVPPQPVSQITIAPEDLARRRPPPAYLNENVLAEKYNIPVVWLQYILDEQAIPYEGIWQEGRKDEYARYYSPQAEEYLKQNAPASMRQLGEMTTSNLANLYGLSFDAMSKIIDDSEVEGTERSIGPKRRLVVYSLEEVNIILGEVAKIPIAAADDVVYAGILKEAGRSFVAGFCDKEKIVPVLKRRNAEHGIKGFALHITADQAERIREGRRSVPIANPEHHIRVSEIARLGGGIHTKTVHSKLTDDERAQGRPMFFQDDNGRPGIATHFPRALGLEIADRLRPIQLAPYQVPLLLIERRVVMDKDTIITRLATVTEPQKLHLAGSGTSRLSCYDWKALEYIEQRTTLRPGVEPVDFSRLIYSPDDTDLDRWVYSQTIQAQYLPSLVLAELPKLSAAEQSNPAVEDSKADAIEIRALCQTLHCTPAALHRIASILKATHDDFVYSPENRITHLHQDMADRIRGYAKQVASAPPRRSISQRRFLLGLRELRLSRDAMQNLSRYLTDPKLWGVGWCTEEGRSDEIDLFCSLETAAAIRRKANLLR